MAQRSPPDMLFTRDGISVPLGNMYRGRSAFLLCSGPSLNTHNLALLQERGVLTCAVNNAAAVHRPHLWVSADDPGNFCDGIWRDAGILKFVPLCHMEKRFQVRSLHENLQPSTETVGDMPAVFGFHRNEVFSAETWLYEDSFNWGNHTNRVDAYGNKGSRSIMYIALRLLFYLGIRRLYLLGCDFRMELGKQNYAFEQDRSAASVRGNNSSYRILNERLKHLLPSFAAEGYTIFNCTPESGLTVFPHLPFTQAIEEVRRIMPSQLVTSGMYDRVANEKKKTLIGRQTMSRRTPLSRQHQVSAYLPPMTLVVRLTQNDVSLWQYTWQTWIRYKPWLARLPLVVVHDAMVSKHAPELRFLQETARLLKFIPLENQDWNDTEAQTAASLVKIPGEYVTTPWYIELSPRLIATNNHHWIDPLWFSQNNHAPVFIVGSRKPEMPYCASVDAVDRLDAWATTVPALAQYPSVTSTFDPADKRSEYEPISTECLFVETDWIRRISRFAPGELPCSSPQTYVHYCAVRRQDHFLRVPLENLGWEFHQGAPSNVARRCRQLLA